jgi:hypothetical protein
MKFDYGDDVVFRTKDDAGDGVDKSCSVVGITPIESEEPTKYFKHSVGSVLCTVEFSPMR